MNKMFSEDDDYGDLRGRFLRFKCFVEIIILSMIGVVMKMLFGMDDVTERYQSRFASKVNAIVSKHLKKESMERDSAESWTEHFIKVRIAKSMSVCPRKDTEFSPGSRACY